MSVFYNYNIIYSRLSRCITARESGTGSSLVDPTKVKALNLFYSLKVPIFEYLKHNLTVQCLEHNGNDTTLVGASL